VSKPHKNPNLVKRLSSAATRKLETILRFGATALRDQILDETLNKHAERIDVDDPMIALEAASSLNTAREIAVKLGNAYQRALLTGFSLSHWYQACGLDAHGELYDVIFTKEEDHA